MCSGRNSGRGISSFITRSRYVRDVPIGYSTGPMDDGVDEAWGGGASIEIYTHGTGTSATLGMRAYADSEGVFGGFTLGLAWLR